MLLGLAFALTLPSAAGDATADEACGKVGGGHSEFGGRRDEGVTILSEQLPHLGGASWEAPWKKIQKLKILYFFLEFSFIMKPLF